MRYIDGQDYADIAAFLNKSEGAGTRNPPSSVTGIATYYGSRTGTTVIKQEDLLAQGLMEMQSGRSIKEIVHSYPMDQQQELASLLEVGVHLQELPRNIELPGTNKARLAGAAHVPDAHPTPRPARFSWRNPLAGVAELFSMPRLQPMLLRPLGAALSAFMAISLVSGGTVYASMDTIPGDNLYPVKIAVEQTRLNLNFNEEGRAETYLWMANARVGELNRMVSEGRLDEAPMVIANYEHSVSEAIRLVSVEKDPRAPSFYEQANTVQTALVALYEKARCPCNLSSETAYPLPPPSALARA